ncbi:MAG: hypothetical protein M3P18_20085, partial [Actinomycetota bacterium]|nr:hypothetical protein [Actinomycetota bacterium]
GYPDRPLLSVYRDWGVVTREGRDDNFNKPGDDLSAYQLVRPSDLVLNKMKTWQGSLGVSALEGIVSPAYFVARQVGEVEPRFAHHLLRSSALISIYAARSKGIRPNQWDLAWDDFKGIRVRLPEAKLQLAIAGYLDTATARIDRLIELARARGGLTEQRLVEATAFALAERRWPLVPFNSVVGYREGPGVLSGDIREEGVPLLRITNLRDDTIVLEDLRYLDAEMVNERWAHMRVRTGELIVSASATSGLPAIVPPEAEGAVPWTGLIRMWPLSARLDRDYLQAFLGSSTFLSQVNSLRTGIGLKHWGPSHLAHVRIPLPPVEDQRRIAFETAADRGRMRRIRAASEREMELLTERRRSLISAAVTERLEIPGFVA